MSSREEEERERTCLEEVANSTTGRRPSTAQHPLESAASGARSHAGETHRYREDEMRRIRISPDSGSLGDGGSVVSLSKQRRAKMIGRCCGEGRELLNEG